MAKQSKTAAPKGTPAKQLNAKRITAVQAAAKVAPPKPVPAPVPTKGKGKGKAPVVAPVPTKGKGKAPVAVQPPRKAATVLGVYVLGPRPPRHSAAHTQAAWQAVAAAVGTKGATQAMLLALPPLAHPQCVSPSAFLGYAVRRGWLAVQPAK